MSWLQALTEFFPLQELQDRKGNKGMVWKEAQMLTETS